MSRIVFIILITINVVLLKVSLGFFLVHLFYLCGLDYKIFRFLYILIIILYIILRLSIDFDRRIHFDQEFSI